MGRKAAVAFKTKQVPPPEPVEVPLDFAEVPDEPEDDLVAEAEGDAEPSVTDNIGEQSVEINVEGLIAELQAETRKAGKPEVISARRKLEDFLERKRIAQDLEDFEDFQVGD
jgi:hypothetical protein